MWRKYLTVFRISWQDQFIYRLNFLLWRLRNILRFLMAFFLWKGIFVGNKVAFGYSQSEILTYVFVVLAIQSLVISAPSSDNIGGEIGSGDLSNYLVKPIGYLKYWFTRDVASKVLNVIFAIGELFVVWFIFRPILVFPSDIVTVVAFLISSLLALTTYYLVSSSTRFLAFWTPENTWGAAFLIFVFTDILSGGVFPLNILPVPIYVALQFTPFPYFGYFPVAIFTGKIVGLEMVRILFQSMTWLIIAYLLTKWLWKKGLVVYQASGR